MESREPEPEAQEKETQASTEYATSPPVYAAPPVSQKRPQIPLLLTGVVAFAIGVFLWGSLFLVILSAGQASDPPTPSNDVQEASPRETPQIDCAELAEQGSLSPGEQALFQEQCGDMAADAEDEAPPQPQEVLNRENCNAIRGTEYRSPEERTWFLANCVIN